MADDKRRHLRGAPASKGGEFRERERGETDRVIAKPSKWDDYNSQGSFLYPVPPQNPQQHREFWENVEITEEHVSLVREQYRRWVDNQRDKYVEDSQRESRKYGGEEVKKLQREFNSNFPYPLTVYPMDAQGFARAYGMYSNRDYEWSSTEGECIERMPVISIKENENAGQMMERYGQRKHQPVGTIDPHYSEDKVLQRRIDGRLRSLNARVDDNTDANGRNIHWLAEQLRRG